MLFYQTKYNDLFVILLENVTFGIIPLFIPISCGQTNTITKKASSIHVRFFRFSILYSTSWKVLWAYVTKGWAEREKGLLEAPAFRRELRGESPRCVSIYNSMKVTSWWGCSSIYHLYQSFNLIFYLCYHISSSRTTLPAKLNKKQNQVLMIVLFGY